jgi:formylglycine-generating enzyme required for sulfatase activity
VGDSPRPLKLQPQPLGPCNCGRAVVYSGGLSVGLNCQWGVAMVTAADTHVTSPKAEHSTSSVAPNGGSPVLSDWEISRRHLLYLLYRIERGVFAISAGVGAVVLGAVGWFDEGVAGAIGNVMASLLLAFVLSRIVSALVQWGTFTGTTAWLVVEVIGGAAFLLVLVHEAYWGLNFVSSCAVESVSTEISRAIEKGEPREKINVPWGRWLVAATNARPIRWCLVEENRVTGQVMLDVADIVDGKGPTRFDWADNKMAKLGLDEWANALIKLGAGLLVVNSDRALDVTCRAINGFARTHTQSAADSLWTPRAWEWCVERVGRPARAAGDEREVGVGASTMKMGWCPPGTFLMGSPPDEPLRRDDERQVEVTISDGFWLGKHEVSQAQWKAVMRDNPSSFASPGGKPVESVSWDEAAEFCKKLTEQEGTAGRLPGGWEFRLPSEAQWEYGCRAGHATMTAFGSELPTFKDANFGGSLGRPADVGSYQPNAWGMHDMHGNVWEWCRDTYVKTLPGGTDPEARENSPERVIRGGGWRSESSWRSAARWKFPHGSRDRDLGFRIALVRIKR